MAKHMIQYLQFRYLQWPLKIWGDMAYHGDLPWDLPKKKPGIPGPTKKKQSGDLNDFGGGHRAPLMVN